VTCEESTCVKRKSTSTHKCLVKVIKNNNVALVELINKTMKLIYELKKDMFEHKKDVTKGSGIFQTPRHKN
jgi:hypothetical protein